VDSVLLDAAGTLIRPREPVEETYGAAARRFGVELDLDKLPRAFDAVLDDMPDLAFDWTSMDELRRRERDWWRDFVRRVIGSAGGHRVGDFDGFFETLYEHYTQGRVWECFPDVPPALNALRARGCKLAVVSNFDSRLPRILREVGLWDQMDAVVYSSEAGSAKPDPVIFKKALAQLGVSAERAIHVGDNPRADIGGATAAGIGGLLIRRGQLPASEWSDSTIASFAHLIALIDGAHSSPLRVP
jgi:putative hydrolase of the HAD superfamily